MVSWVSGSSQPVNEEAVALAERLNHPYSLAAALDFSAWVDQLRGDSEAARMHAEKAIAISTKHDFVFWLLTGMILHGWALTNVMRLTRAYLRCARRSQATNRPEPESCDPTIWRCWRMFRKNRGEKAEAFRLLDEAEVAVRASGERWWEAELYRVKGELTLNNPRRKLAVRQRKNC